MIETFIGGYGYHPAALDYSGDTCDNGCAYCFANINKQYREGQLKRAINFFYKKDITTYNDMLFKMGYPICVSNRTDPFTEKNKKDTIALFTHLSQFKNGIFIQTKCGYGMDECVDILCDKKEIVFYITITTINPDIAKVLEPKAPNPHERLDIAKKLLDKGYYVIIAVNPLNEAWMNRVDLTTLMIEMKKRGLFDMVIEMLHMSPARLRKIGDGRKERMGNALDSVGYPNRIYVRDSVFYAIDNGMNVLKMGLPLKTNVYDKFRIALGLVMPSIQDFISYCIEKYGKSNAIIKYSEYENIMAQSPIFKKSIKQNNIRDYLIRMNFKLWKENQRIHSHKELLKIIWNNKSIMISPIQNPLFRIVNKNGECLKDENGDIELYYEGGKCFFEYKNSLKEAVEL